MIRSNSCGWVSHIRESIKTYFICELRELLNSLLWLVHLSQHTVSLDYRRSRGLKPGAHAHGGFCAEKLNV